VISLSSSAPLKAALIEGAQTRTLGASSVGRPRQCPFCAQRQHQVHECHVLGGAEVVLRTPYDDSACEFLPGD